MSNPRTISPGDWETHKETIERLYIGEDKTLEQLLQYMQHHGFHASKGQYKRQLNKWKISKNISAKDWKRISRIVAARDSIGKTSQIVVQGKTVVSPEKVRKETRRYDLPSFNVRTPSPRLPAGILVCTPPEDTSQLDAKRVAYSSMSLMSPDDLSEYQNPVLDLVESVVASNLPEIFYDIEGIQTQLDSPVFEPKCRASVLLPDDLPCFQFSDLVEQHCKHYFSSLRMTD